MKDKRLASVNIPAFDDGDKMKDIREKSLNPLIAQVNKLSSESATVDTEIKRHSMPVKLMLLRQKPDRVGEFHFQISEGSGTVLQAWVSIAVHGSTFGWEN